MRAVAVAFPTEEVPAAYPQGRLWRTCSYNLAVLEAAQLPGSLFNCSGSEELPELSRGQVWISVEACEQKGTNDSASLLWLWQSLLAMV